MKVSFWRIALAYFGTPFLFGAHFGLTIFFSSKDEKINIIDLLLIEFVLGSAGVMFMSIPALVLSLICWVLSKWLKNTIKVAFIMFFVTFFLFESLIGESRFCINNLTFKEIFNSTIIGFFFSALISSSLYYFLNRPKKNDPSKIVDE